MIDNIKNSLKEKEDEFNKLNKNFDFLLNRKFLLILINIFLMNN